MPKRRIGRTRIRLAEMLTESLGVRVDPEDFWIQEGAYRSAAWDLARWGTYNPELGSIYSWDTMTQCVRNGFAFTTKERNTEIFANS